MPTSRLRAGRSSSGGGRARQTLGRRTKRIYQFDPLGMKQRPEHLVQNEVEIVDSFCPPALPHGYSTEPTDSWLPTRPNVPMVGWELDPDRLSKWTKEEKNSS